MTTKSDQQTLRAIKRYRAMKVGRLVTRYYYYAKKDDREALYNLIGDELLGLGGVYIKFLQSLVLQSSNLMKYWKNPKRLSVFEDLNNEPLDIEQVLIDNLGHKQAAELEKVGLEPFAAGSFGQVYSAHLAGKPVIIKVLRPQIKELLKFDLRLLRYFWKVSSRYIASKESLNFSDSFEDYAQQTLNETDYAAEAQFADEQYKIYADHPTLKIPKTYLEYCTDQIIVQEYIGGISAAYLIKLHQQGVNAEKYIKNKLGSDLITQLQTVAYETIWGAFHQTRIMADAHPGNVKLLKNNQVALIDFGISVATPTTNRAACFGLIVEYSKMISGRLDAGRMFVSCLRFFRKDLYRALIKLSTLSRNRIDLNRELAKIAKKQLETSLTKEELNSIAASPKSIALFNQIINRHGRLEIKATVDDIGFMRANLAFSALAAGLGLHQTVMTHSLKKVVEQVNQVYPQLKTQGEAEMSNAEAIDVVSNWLERIANRDPVLFQNLMTQLRLRSREQLKLVND